MGFKTILTWHYSTWKDWVDENTLDIILLKIKDRVLLTNSERQIWNAIKNERELLRERYDKIIALSNESYQNLNRIYNIHSSQIVKINNGLDDSNQNSQHRKSFSKEKIILFVGRLDKNKNVSFLIEAFQMAKKTNKNIQLVIAGRGNYDEALTYISHEYSKIYFTGFLSHSSLRKLYSKAFLGVIPSLHEESPYVAIEMLMYGIPIISNNIGGLSEIITPNKNGILLDMTDSNRRKAISELARKIIEILSNNNFHDFLSINARLSYEKGYNIHKFSRMMLSLYYEI